MDIKREMAILLTLVGYLSFGIGYLNEINQKTESLEKETEVLVSQIVDDLEEIYLQQHK